MSNLQVTIEAEPSFSRLAAKYNLTGLEVKQIATSGINRSLASIKTRVVRRLTDSINIRAKDIRPLVTIQKANYDKLVGSVTVSKKPVPLYDFIGSRQTAAGVSVLVVKADAEDNPKAGVREVLKGTFIQTMPNGHVGIFERLNHLASKGPNAFKGGLTPGRQYRAAWRFAIGERFGLTLTGYLTHAPTVIAEETAAAMGIFEKNIMSQLSRRLAARP